MRRVALLGAVGALGYAVYYFLDPELGPRRRREAIDTVRRLSQELVSRIVEPPEASEPIPPARQVPPPEPVVERRIVQPERQPDLASALHGEVAFFTVGDDSTLTEAVPVGVAATRPETLHLAEASVHEGPSYAVGAPQPRIIAYDAAEPGFDDEGPARVDEAPPASDHGRSKLGLVAVAAVAALLLAAAALGAWAVWGDDSGSSATAVPAGAAEALDLISQPGAQRVAVAGSKETMVLVVAPGGKAALIISGLKSAPQGKEYQAWIVAGGKPKSAGLFKGGQTRLVIPLSQKIPKGAIFAVTLEKAGGVPMPTQSPQYTAKLG